MTPLQNVLEANEGFKPLNLHAQPETVSTTLALMPTKPQVMHTASAECAGGLWTITDFRVYGYYRGP